MPGSELFAPILTTDELLEATGDEAWLRAMLDAEAALALAEADVGIIPLTAAEAIAATCAATALDPAALGRGARQGGNPVIPLVRSLTERVPEPARTWVHWGATSQDILDTAAMLIVARSLPIVDRHLAGLAGACAHLCVEHRSTLMAGRTLLQPAVPITFGLKAAGWLVGVVDARLLLTDARSHLAAELGGAAGTLASLGGDGPAVIAAFARRLDLAEPVLAWHTARQRVAQLGCALGIVAGTAAKVSLDVALLMQAEVGEAQEPAVPGRGSSSTLPTKRNPVGAAAVGAAARRAHALVPLLLSATVAEHERALGAWQAEWEALAELLALAGGAAARTEETIRDLEVHPEVMAEAVRRNPGLLAERMALALAPEMGREAAAAAAAAGDHGSLAPDRVRELLDPAGYLGATDTWIDRALDYYEAHR